MEGFLKITTISSTWPHEILTYTPGAEDCSASGFLLSEKLFMVPTEYVVRQGSPRATLNILERTEIRIYGPCPGIEMASTVT
jgi:hypothetical protein